MAKMSKRKFRIGVLSSKLQVERFVIRFWEQEFELRTARSSGKQRYYSEDDLKKFTLIKDLLYNKCYTIAGAKKELADTERTAHEQRVNNARHIPATSSAVVSSDLDRLKAENELLWQQISVLQSHLKKLQQLL